MRDLFRGYNKLIRPVQNMTQKVEVAFGLAFIQLINVVRIFLVFLSFSVQALKKIFGRVQACMRSGVVFAKILCRHIFYIPHSFTSSFNTIFMKGTSAFTELFHKSVDLVKCLESPMAFVLSAN